MIRLLALLFVAAAAASSPAAATCFDGQIPPAPWAAAAARAAVRVMLVRADGRPFGAASGVVVAGSGTTSDANDRLLTAGHVVRDLRAQPGGWIAIYDSAGIYLGTATSAALGSPGPAFGLVGAVQPGGLHFGDVAVLRMSAFTPEGAPAFAAIAGLPLARAQPPGLLRGEVSVPAGIDPGVSGAGVIGPDGGLLGVMAFKEKDDAPPVEVLAGRDDGGGRMRVRLPRHAVAYATPLADRAILAALNAAGRRVARGSRPWRAQVLVPAYLKGACVAFRAVMGPA